MFLSTARNVRGVKALMDMESVDLSRENMLFGVVVEIAVEIHLINTWSLKKGNFE